MTLQRPLDGKPGPPDQAQGGGVSGRRIGAYVAGGLGLGALALGGVAGGMTIQKKSIIEKNCVETICNAEGKAAADSSRATGLLSTIGFGVGAAGLAAGLVLLLTEPSSQETGSVKPAVLGAGSRGATRSWPARRR